MIYITGDTHIPIDIEKLNTKNFPEQMNMTKDDCVIICGDFGGVWSGGKRDGHWIKWLDGKNFTTLFVDGNHENHPLLNGHYEVARRYGGKVHRVADSVYHLMRGEVYSIGGKTLFAMGGAASHDKEYRVEGVSWWPEEMPSEEEYKNAEDNLSRCGWTVDLIVSHCCPDSIQSKISDYYEHNRLTNFFECVIKANCKYKAWFFGHYHEDLVVDERHVCLYNGIVEIE